MRAAEPAETPAGSPLEQATGAGGGDRGFSFGEWWCQHVLANVDHDAVVAQVREDSGWSTHFAFMTLMSAGIAILGLLLSSPAVVIGAMLISPLMGPIIGIGFALATFDSLEIRRNLRAILVGTAMAIAFCAIIVLASPLQSVTPEIASRTRPNLFDLLVALLSGLAATYAMIRGRHGAIVGVAIATALMPPIAVMGFGIATANWPVLSGSFLLFFTNLMTIAASAAVLARLYGFAANLSPQQTGLQATLLILSLVLLAVPLGLSLRQIAWEALASREVKATIAEAFGDKAHLGDVDIAFDTRPIAVSATVLTPAYRGNAEAVVGARLKQQLGQDIDLAIDQVRIVDGADPSLLATTKAASVERSADRIARQLAAVSGIGANAVLVDRSRNVAQARAVPLPGATLRTYYEIERRLSRSEPGWTIQLIPPLAPLGPVGDDEARRRDGLRVAGWAGARTGVPIEVAGPKHAVEAAVAVLGAAGATTRIGGTGGPLRLSWSTGEER